MGEAGGLEPLCWRRGGAPTSMHVWRPVPVRLRSMLETLGLAIEAVRQQYALIPGAVRGAVRTTEESDVAGAPRSEAAEAATAATAQARADADAASRAALRFGVSCVRPWVDALAASLDDLEALEALEARAPSSEGGAPSSSSSSSSGAALLAAFGVAAGHSSRTREEGRCVAVWHACLSLAQHVPRVCLLAATAPSSLPTSPDAPAGPLALHAPPAAVEANEIAQMCAALEALAQRAISRWARALSGRCLLALPRPAAPPPPCAAAAAAATATAPAAAPAAAPAEACAPSIPAPSAALPCQPGRIDWHAAPLGTSLAPSSVAATPAASSAAAAAAAPRPTIPLPHRPSDLLVRRVTWLLTGLHEAAAVALHPAALATLAQEARRAFAHEMQPVVAAALATSAAALPDSAMQLMFDLRYLDAALSAVHAPAAGGAARPGDDEAGGPTLRSLERSLVKLSEQIDLVAHRVADKPLQRAVQASLTSLGTLASPIRGAPLAPPTAMASMADAAERGIFRLPAPPCPRFSYLPVKTPPLHATPHAGGGATATAGHASAALPRGADADGQANASAVSGMLARVGGVLSSATRRTALGERMLGGLGLSAVGAREAGGAPPRT